MQRFHFLIREMGAAVYVAVSKVPQSTPGKRKVICVELHFVHINTSSTQFHRCICVHTDTRALTDMLSLNVSETVGSQYIFLNMCNVCYTHSLSYKKENLN